MEQKKPVKVRVKIPKSRLGRRKKVGGGKKKCKLLRKNVESTDTVIRETGRNWGRGGEKDYGGQAIGPTETERTFAGGRILWEGGGTKGGEEKHAAIAQSKKGWHWTGRARRKKQKG